MAALSKSVARSLRSNDSDPEQPMETDQEETSAGRKDSSARSSMPPPSTTEVRRASRDQQEAFPKASKEYLERVKGMVSPQLPPAGGECSTGPRASTQRSPEDSSVSSGDEYLHTEIGASRLPSSQVPLYEVPAALAKWVRKLRDRHHHAYDAATRVHLTAEYDRKLTDVKQQLAVSQAENDQVRATGLRSTT